MASAQAKLRFDTINQPIEQFTIMPANLTLKGLPDELHERLKTAAAANHRSLNSEIIALLEAQLLPRRIPAEDRLAAIRAARARVARKHFDHEAIDRIKRAGRA